MSFLDIVRLLDLALTTEQRRACAYLERHANMAFCVDYGYDNAIEKARAHWNARRRQKRRK